jgi:hypothetical protein
VKYEALDNGLLSCSKPKRAQEICDGLSARKIDMFVRKWLRILPFPFTPADTRAGYRYAISVVQAEFSLTQVLDRPQTGRVFFEEIIRENLDIGRPSQVQLIFGRRLTRRTPGRFRTRVLTEGVTPSLHIDYKRSRIKQYQRRDVLSGPRPRSTTRWILASARRSTPPISRRSAKSDSGPTAIS